MSEPIERSMPPEITTTALRGGGERQRQGAQRQRLDVEGAELRMDERRSAPAWRSSRSRHAEKWR